MHRQVALIIAAVVSTFGNAVSHAQESTGSLYLMVGAGFPHQDGVQGAQRMNYAAPPEGGTRAWIVGGGIFVAPKASVSSKRPEQEP